MKKAVKATGLRAIADEVNVSVSLVSKVLNNRLGNSRVAPQTIRTIQAAAQSLGYHKNHAAAALVAGRQNVIGGFVHQLGVPTSGIAEQLVRGMAAGAASHGRRLMLRFFSSTDEFLAYTPEISPSLLDGLIIAGIRHNELEGTLAEIEAAGVPIVTVHEQQMIASHRPNVYVDQTTVCDIATEHLIQQGCRHIAHIKMVEDRFQGYMRALRRHGLRAEASLVYRASSFAHTAGMDAVAHLLANRAEFDGIVAQSDEQAIGALHALIGAGLRVPQDVKIIGVDNSPLCSVASTSLSSISTEFYTQGTCAIDLLVRLIDGCPTSTMSISPILVPRESSGPVQLSGGPGSVNPRTGKTTSSKGVRHALSA